MPFAKFFGSRFDPNDNDTIGASVWELQLFSYSVIEFGNVESSAYVLCPGLEYLLSTASVHYFSPLRVLSMQ